MSARFEGTIVHCGLRKLGQPQEKPHSPLQLEGIDKDPQQFLQLLMQKYRGPNLGRSFMGYLGGHGAMQWDVQHGKVAQITVDAKKET